MTSVLATRKLVTRDGSSFEVTLFAPETTPIGTSQCKLHFDLSGVVETYTTDGTDEFQVLTLALYAIWRRVEELGCKFESSSCDGEHGFSRVILRAPPVYSVARLHAMIDAEEQRIEDELAASGDSRP